MQINLLLASDYTNLYNLTLGKKLSRLSGPINVLTQFRLRKSDIIDFMSPIKIQQYLNQNVITPIKCNKKRKRKKKMDVLQASWGSALH